jgi:hypothetical protein
MTVGPLPTFMIIGAAKAGTTSLHNYLGEHPEISMSWRKDTDFFRREDYRDALEEYSRYFESGTAARGEASVHCTYWPEIPDIPERISTVLPDLKLIYCVRDPVDRAISHYHERYQSNAAPRSIDEAFSELTDSKVWIASSKYTMQLERFLKYYPRRDLMIVDDRDLRFEREATLSAIFEFVGVDPDFSSPAFREEHNVRLGGRKRMNKVGQTLKRSPVAAVARRTLPPEVKKRVFARARPMFTVPVPRQELPADARSRLADYLSDDVARFRHLAGRSFEHWSV